MSLQDDLPTKSERPPKKGRRLSGAQEVDVSASLEEFIGSACALLEEPQPITEPEPEPAPAAEPDPIAERMAQIEEALVRAATRAAALADAPPPARARGRLGVSVAAAAIGAFLGVVVLLVGFGRSQGERPVAAQPAQAAPAPVQAAPVKAAPAPQPVPPAPQAAPEIISSAAAAPPVPSPPTQPARHKVVPTRRHPAPRAGGSGGIVDPFAN